MKVFSQLISCFTIFFLNQYVSTSKLSNNPIYTLQLKGNSSELHYYYVDLYFGSSHSKQSLIIDTGSSLTGFPCKSVCVNCGKHINEHYDFRMSSNSNIISCKDADSIGLKCDFCNNNNFCSYHQSYGEGSTYSGLFINDSLSLGSNLSFHMPIGCHSKETNQLQTQLADGILGLSPRERRFSGFLSHLKNSSVISSKIFSLCLGENYGFLSIGGVNNTYHIEPQISYIKYEAHELYTVSLDSISIGSNKISAKYNAGLDSGTTNTYMPKDLFDQLFRTFTEFCSIPDSCHGDLLKVGDDICIYKKKSYPLHLFYNSLPSIKFRLKGGYVLEWLPQHYMSQNKSNLNELCMNFHKWDLEKLMLGSSVMIDYDIIFNLETNHIGLVKANCGKPNSLIHKGFKRIAIEDNSTKIYEQTCQDTINNYVTAIIILSVILTGIIIILSIAVYKLKSGESFLFFKFDSEEAARLNEEIRKSQKEIDKVMDEIHSVG